MCKINLRGGGDLGYKDPNHSPNIISVCFHPSFLKITTHSIYLNVSIGNGGCVLGVKASFPMELCPAMSRKMYDHK